MSGPKYWIWSLCILSMLSSCQQDTPVEIPMPPKESIALPAKALDRDTYYDRVLGALVGSAIGDAMGASTEMWHRSDIQNRYGYIKGLTNAIREKSPEGTWRHDMIAGATTDDTRWKYFVGAYLIAQRGNWSQANFAQFITDYYQAGVQGLAEADSQQSTDVLDEKIDQVNWIKEWARVAMAYQEGKEEFIRAQSRFYGGEMSCAGMLYGPMFGLVERNPETAYLAAFDHALFDLGYAKDISGLTGAMTRMALQSNNLDSLLRIQEWVDPHGFRDSRLIGRLATNLANEARGIVDQAKSLDLAEMEAVSPPPGYPGSEEEWIRQNYIYQELEKRQKAIPFHAGEIWQINVAGLAFGGGDFQKTMAFIVNYGRDNDTVAAVTGMVLGAQLGYQNLPADLREPVLQVTKEVVGIDLEALAREITNGLKD